MRTLILLTATMVSLPAAESDVDLIRGVNKAIDKGKASLARLQDAQGTWEGQEIAGKALSYFADQNGGVTALATLALLTSGTPADDKVVAKGLDYIRSLEPRKTYVVSLSIMALAEARQTRDLDRIQKLTDWLLTKAVYRGGKLSGWGYPQDNISYVDGSNTQYAILGLYAAKQAGVKIDDAKWKDIANMYLTCQKDESNTAAYWRYDLDQNVKDYGASFTMTIAGLCGLFVSGMGLESSAQKLDDSTGIAANCGKYDSNGPVAKGMNWVAARFSFDAAPAMKMSVLYNVYGIERLGRLSGQRFIGKHDWYRKGCKFLLDTQKDDGTWTRPDKVADKVPAVATSFALLFLAKGRTPLLISKFAHGDAAVRDGMIAERGEPGVIGWNRKQNDMRNLTEFASRELFGGVPLGWQAYDARKVNLSEAEIKSEVEGLLACPIVYLSGHGPLVLSSQQEQILKQYIDEGGFLFAEACCGDDEFAKSFVALMGKLFHENQLTRMPANHAIWNSFFSVSPADFPFVDVLQRGCKTVVVFTQTPTSGYWEEARFAPVKGKPAANQGQRAWQFAGNVIAYATGMQAPEQKGTKRLIADNKNDVKPPRDAVQPVQLLIRDDPPPAPAAMRNLMTFIGAATSTNTSVKNVQLRPDAELTQFPLLYLHGRRRLDFTDAEITNLRAHLELHGLLFADAACGKKEFDESFRAMMKKIFPDKPLEVIPLTDAIYSEDVNGKGNAVRTVKRREKSDGSGPDGGYKELPPHLEGIKIDGRWVVIYSKWDVGCALEKHNSTECLGHTHESALKLGGAVVLYALKR